MKFWICGRRRRFKCCSKICINRLGHQADPGRRSLNNTAGCQQVNDPVSEGVSPGVSPGVSQSVSQLARQPQYPSVPLGLAWFSLIWFDSEFKRISASLGCRVPWPVRPYRCPCPSPNPSPCETRNWKQGKPKFDCEGKASRGPQCNSLMGVSIAGRFLRNLPRNWLIQKAST